jgi:hypothetical protein
MAAAAVPAAAVHTDLVSNGGFETTTLTGSSQFSDYYTGNVVADWTTSGYNFIFFPGTATTTGAANQYGGALTLYGPGNGVANGYADSPTGGNYVAADGAYIVAPIQQTLTGLVVGQRYAVGFDWAAAQQTGFNGKTTELWQVSLGGETHSTPVWDNANHGFKPWSHATIDFTATATSEVLSFLAVGTPNGEPPFSLLDGVTTTAVPEPASWALMIGGLGLIGGALRARRRGIVAA